MDVANLPNRHKTSQDLPPSLRVQDSVVASIANLAEVEEAIRNRYAKLSLIASRVLLERIARGSVVSQRQWQRFALLASGEL